MKTVVAILNWNGLKLLQEFLPDVIRYSSPHAKIAVIDNSSSDESVSWIKAHHPDVQVIENTTNEGFASGYNTGLKQIDAELFILLNSDVKVTETWLAPLIAMFGDEKVVAAQPKVRSYHQPEYFEYAGAAGGFMDRDGFIFCRGRIFDSFEKDNGQYNNNREIFWATGACLAVRSNAYWSVGGLDEDFFAHMEEIDLCWRLKNTGKRIMYCSESTVYHVGGGTLNKINPRKTYLNFRNNLFLLLKNYRLGNVMGKLFFRMFLDGLAVWKFLFQGQWRHCGAVLRAHYSFYSSFGKFRQKRKQLEDTIHEPNTSGYYHKSIVWQYFMKGKRKFSELDEQDFS